MKLTCFEKVKLWYQIVLSDLTLESKYLNKKLRLSNYKRKLISCEDLLRALNLKKHERLSWSSMRIITLQMKKFELKCLTSISSIDYKNLNLRHFKFTK